MDETNQTILARLDEGSIARLKHSAKEASKIEATWDAAVKKRFKESANVIFEEMMRGGHITDLGIEKMFIEHSFRVSFDAVGVAMEEDEIDRRYRNLAKAPKAVAPKSIADLRRQYDLWRRGQYTPKRASKIGASIQAKYLKKIQEIWKNHAEEFRAGNAFTQKEVKEAIEREAEVASNRAQTVVRTETTNYYNQARRTYYDASPDVTHYLYMAVRDAGTTKWCTPKVTEGKRGRHGLVYIKGDPLLIKETPACHWNCRSELLPLTIENPSHRRLIEDKSIQRRAVLCWPLPPNWN